MRSTPRVLPDLNESAAFEMMILKQLEAFILEVFPQDRVLRKESVWILWNPIFNTAVESTSKPDRGSGVVWYTSTNQLLTSDMVNHESRLQFARRKAFWMYGMVCSVIRFVRSDLLERIAKYR